MGQSQGLAAGVDLSIGCWRGRKEAHEAGAGEQGGQGARKWGRAQPRVPQEDLSYPSEPQRVQSRGRAGSDSHSQDPSSFVCKTGLGKGAQGGGVCSCLSQKGWWLDQGRGSAHMVSGLTLESF